MPNLFNPLFPANLNNSGLKPIKEVIELVVFVSAAIVYKLNTNLNMCFVKFNLFYRIKNAIL